MLGIMSKPNTSPSANLKPLRQMVTTAGNLVFAQGAPSFQAFYIESGLVEVTASDGDHSIKLAELGPGEIFGEMGVLENEVRMAAVRALEETTLSVLSREDLEDRMNVIEDKYIKALINAQIKRVRESGKAQLQYYRDMVALQDRMLGLAENVGRGIQQDQRETFAAEVTPLLEALEKTLEKYGC